MTGKEGFDHELETAAAIAGLTFEEGMARLEELVGRLESGQLTLDESLRLFQEGVALARRCSRQLDEVQAKVETVMTSPDGSLLVEPWETNQEGA